MIRTQSRVRKSEMSCERRMSVWLLIFKMANEKVDLGQIRSEEIVYSRFIKIPLG